MHDLGVREDNNVINSHSTGNASKSSYIKQTVLKRGKNKRTITKKVSLNNISRPFRVMAPIFRFYGVKIFKQHILKYIQKVVESGLEQREHANIWKLIMFDLLSSFIHTAKYYYKGNEDLYTSCMCSLSEDTTNTEHHQQLSLANLYELYDQNAKLEIKRRYKESMMDGLMETDPIVTKQFTQMLVKNIPNKSDKIDTK